MSASSITIRRERSIRFEFSVLVCDMRINLLEPQSKRGGREELLGFGVEDKLETMVKLDVYIIHYLLLFRCIECLEVENSVTINPSSMVRRCMRSCHAFLSVCFHEGLVCSNAITRP